MSIAWASRVGLCLAAALALPASASAAGIAPPNPVHRHGPGNLVRNGNTIWTCNWTFKMKTGPSIGGTPARASGGTMTGGVGSSSSNCATMTVQPTTWSLTSATSGVFHGLEFRQSGAIFCQDFGDVPFTVMQSGGSITSFFFNSASFGGNCNFNDNLSLVADMSVLP